MKKILIIGVQQKLLIIEGFLSLKDQEQYEK